MKTIEKIIMLCIINIIVKSEKKGVVKMLKIKKGRNGGREENRDKRRVREEI